MKFEQHFDAVVVKAGGVLDTGNERSESALASVRHGVRSRLVHCSEDRSLQVQDFIQIVEHFARQLKAETTEFQLSYLEKFCIK